MSPKVAPGTQAERRIRAHNRRIILRAAEETFARKGFDGATIAEIATRCALPKANVYYYFGSKTGLYRAVIDRLLLEWNKAFDHIDAARAPEEAIAAYVRAKLAYSRRNTAASKLFANENVRGSTFLSRRDQASIREITREKAAVVEGWIKAGQLRPVDPYHLFILLWASTQFYADFDSVVRNILGASRLTRATFDRAAETITALILEGCIVQKGQARPRKTGGRARRRS